MWKLKGAMAVLLVPVWVVVWLWGLVTGRRRRLPRWLVAPRVHRDSRHIPPGG